MLLVATIYCWSKSPLKIGMGLLWARDFEDLWEVHGSRCSFFVPSCPRMLVANDIAARSHLYDIYIYAYLKNFIQLGAEELQLREAIYTYIHIYIYTYTYTYTYTYK